MNKIIIGITGGIASGKTLICSILSNNGFIIINADHIVSQITQQGKKAYNLMINLADRYNIADIIDHNNQLNKNIIRKHLFSNSSFKKDLELIIHPLVTAEIQKIINENNKNNLFAVEVPLLFEAGLESIFNKILCIYTPKELMINNIIDRYNINIEDAKTMLKTHLEINLKMLKSDFIIFNNGDKESLASKVSKFITYFAS